MDGTSRNPELLRQMMQSDPRMREVMEANPELGHALNDPETIRRTLEVARNPELMREQMQLSDETFASASISTGFSIEDAAGACGSRCAPPRGGE